MVSILKKEQVFEEANAGNLLPKCILCKEVPKLGIADGFLLIGQFVCSGCEQKLLTLNYDDPAYNIMVQKLKEVIYSSKKSSRQLKKE